MRFLEIGKAQWWIDQFDYIEADLEIFYWYLINVTYKQENNIYYATLQDRLKNWKKGPAALSN